MKKLKLISIALAIISASSIPGGTSLNAGADEPGYWMPAEPPKVQYEIDCSVDPQAGLLKGEEVIRFTNTTSRPIRTLAMMCSAHGSQSLEIIGLYGKAIFFLANGSEM